MKLKNMFILLFILGIADSFITYVFPVDFTFQSMSFVPHIAFMALLLVTYDRKWLDRVLIGGLYGLIYDFFFQSTFPLSFLLFPFFAWLCGFVYEKKEDIFWLSGTFLVSAILLDVLPYIFFRLCGGIQIHAWSWFGHLELATILFQCVTLFALYLGFDLVRSWQKRKSYQTIIHKKKSFRDRLMRK